MRSLSFGFRFLFAGACGLAVGCGGDRASTGSGATVGGGSGTSTAAGGTSTSTGGSGAGTSAGGATGGATTTASGGDGGTGGAGAAGGSGGATTGGSGGTTTSSTTTSSTTATGGMLGDPCTWGDACSGNLYCLAPGCGMGTCQPKPPPAGLSPNPNPVCGCDGVTYWSPDVAASKGQSVAAEGACAMPIVCGPGMPSCPSGMKCSREVADSDSCSPDATGECWGTAISCSLDGPKARACTTHTCELQCSLIQSENPWYGDPTCM